MTYKTKAVREADTKRADAKIKILLNMFGNFMLEKKGIKDKVTEEDIKEFSTLLGK